MLFRSRSVDPGEKRFVHEQGLEVFDMRYIDEMGMRHAMELALATLDANTHLHVSFDVDFLDPDIAPGVGTTVPGGPTYREAQLCMEMIADTGRMASLDLVELNPSWKVVGGLRFDRFEGRNDVGPTTNRDGSVTPAASYERSDNMLSHRLGVMWQPNSAWSFHASYGTSFNTSGDTYSYDALGSNTPPEKSRNFEIGAKLDLLDGALSPRAAIFHSEKYNERNRDPDTAATQYLLSGKRHAQGMELDFAGRLTPQWELFASYAYIWQARIDKSATASEVGTDPGLTPEHSGSVWTTYRVLPALRLGLGVNGRSKQSPVGNAAVTAPAYVTTDLMAEYTFSERVTAKLNVNNVTDELYADQLYRGHYLPGAARNVQLTITSKF